MSDAIDSRFAPPGAQVLDVVSDAAGTPASRGRRFAGAMIDALIGAAASWLLYKLSGFGFLAETGGLRVRAVLVGIAVFLLLQGWLLVRHGQTIGKRLLGMRIVRSDGSAADPIRLLVLRYGIGMAAQIVPVIGGLYGIVDALLIFRASRKCLHDSIADTKVIKL